MSEALIKSVFAGKTEMHALTREFDWANSPLGAIENWSPSLRTAVSICLESMFPIWILWGRKSLTTFYKRRIQTDAWKIETSSIFRGVLEKSAGANSGT